LYIAVASTITVDSAAGLVGVEEVYPKATHIAHPYLVPRRLPYSIGMPSYDSNRNVVKGTPSMITNVVEFEAIAFMN
jgi:hypothetical protein